MNRNVPSNSARYFRAFIIPPTSRPGLGVVHDTQLRPSPRESGARRATSGTGPRRARGGRRRGPDRARPPRRRAARGGRRTASGSGRLGEGGRDPVRRARWLPISPNDEERQARQDGTRSPAARPGPGTSPASVRPIDAGRWAWATAPMSGRAAWTARWMARSEVGPCPLGETASRVGMAEPDDDEVVGAELVLAQPGRRHEQPVGVEADRQVALAGRDQAARTETSTGRDQPIGGGTAIHRVIVRGETGRSRRGPATRGARPPRAKRHGERDGCVPQAARATGSLTGSGAMSIRTAHARALELAGRRRPRRSPARRTMDTRRASSACASTPEGCV